MAEGYEERKARAVHHAANPQPGDYWHEMFSPAALVLEVGAFHVTYLDKQRAEGKGWTWDVEHVAVKSRAEFERWLSYGSIPGTWADVVQNSSHFEEFRDAALASSSIPVGVRSPFAPDSRGPEIPQSEKSGHD